MANDTPLNNAQVLSHVYDNSVNIPDAPETERALVTCIASNGKDLIRVLSLVLLYCNVNCVLMSLQCGWHDAAHTEHAQCGFAVTSGMPF